MASSGKTKNLQLNQWTASDPILHSDFNADNLKIDTAFEKNAIQKVVDKTLTSQQSQIDIDLGQSIDQFAELRIHLFDYAYASGTDRSPAYILLQNRTSIYFENVYTGTNANTFFAQFPMAASVDQASMLTAKIYPGLGSYRTKQMVRCELECYHITDKNIFIRSISSGTHLTEDITSIRTINIRPSISTGIRAGTRVLVYGLKA